MFFDVCFLMFFLLEYICKITVGVVFFMAIMDVKGLNYDIIIDKLKSKGKDAYKLISYVDYLNTDCVCDLVGELNAVFDSKVGNRDYTSRNFINYLYVLF